MEALPKTLFQAPLSLENQSFWESSNPSDGYNFEKVDIKWWRDFVMGHWYYSFVAAGIYLVTIFGLERYMKNRRAYDLRTPLIFWNAALGVFSIIGFMRTAPCMKRHFVSLEALWGGICVRDYTEVPMAFWGIAFGISKYIELGDTVFIVLRKKPLQLLQWVHHILTLIVVWVTLPFAEPVGRWYIVMNYLVHSFMYPYFAMKMAGVDVPKFIANFITTIQLAQMIAGFVLNALTIGLMGTESSCYRTPASITAFLGVYGSFVVLFGRLFKQSVLKANKAKGKQIKSS